ncbi:(R)-mandelonitrile lyase [Nocardia jinanensis]|uniref:Cupin n=1 Tax=Nocardia jinanensis TaxID=382504 RepID=A0A917RR14_9NOCA|nr:cupin domain-containing protein [Nocardia jinanensis]GGL19121.1 cupin [Nocardia jinanensis]
MEILGKPPTTTAPADIFTGPVWFDTVYRGADPSRARLNAVHFAPGARTNWHTHGLGQVLHVTEGTALVVTRAGAVAVLRPGDTVWCPPGEQHWHGAGPEHFMTHLALWEGDDVDWAAPVTAAEYERAASGI